ncbi:zinc metalloprotease HtpX [Candidatus Roizmanbacteria bacterium CG22_combo_CG10-13_8_21_14_all_38_20]|uniref:Protease HtpX homolog n=1 Tax=Candidatus Roizmanbacteria bacterium CG22_combo_CG10-13_8_21_14_all_38_20 TaxID=1974862 RepID=A0A2H0BUM0_9BACT|nr:M48 family metallopeptidase [Candidatus Microgenomates bacterium]PIP61385.1 MAG: zinc metalloprotease HtpX [Candidatus Roizmanbacteria bacterium CG22_combo_CG10-13_8_21_14_all_38_20]PJC31466.1 MAG: zinc metalloprotease HtpX [Candidatus Roizmanbacteria bacterium CG_4_9_14_0_2_um_filter_38_17]
MVLFVLFISTMAYVFGEAGSGYGWIYGIIALVFSVFGSFGSYFYSDKAVLALSNAKLTDKNRDYDFYTAAENMRIASGLPMPKLYVIEDQALNAFATGRDPEHGVVVATRGLLQRLDRSDIEGVVAHEMSHIKNFDTRLMMIVAILVGSVALLAHFFMRSMFWGSGNRDKGKGGGIMIVLAIVFAVLAPIIATLIQLAISRRREYLADASAANMTRNPEGLASALEKISVDHAVLQTATSATAHLFISNPFRSKEARSWFTNFFNTHPPIEERIKILRGM